MRKSDINEQIKLRVGREIEANLKNVYTLTGRFGVEANDKKRYFEGAKKAAETGEVVQEKDIAWIPTYWDKDLLGVCGVKTKNFPKDEMNLINGLVDEVAYEEFLKQEIVKTIDPRSNFIRNLLETEDVKNYEQAIDKGDILGINLRSPQAIIYIRVPGILKLFKSKHRGLSEEQLLIKLTKSRQEFMYKLSNAFDLNENNIVALIKPECFVILKWARGQVNTLNSINFFKKKAQFIQEVVEKETGIKPSVGVGQYYPKLSGLRKSYADAKVAMELGEKIWGEGNIYHIVDVGMFVALSPKFTIERKCELAFQILGQIFADKSLYKTVNVFLENDMNLTEAARKLHLHRNTLIYRLDKIKKEVGLDPRKFSDAIQIKLGMILYSPSQNVCDI